MRDHRVYEKFDEREATAKYQVTSRSGHTQIKRSRGAHTNHVASGGKRIQKWRLTRSACGDPPLEALKAIISLAANRKQTFSMMPIDVSRASCTFTKKTQRLVQVRLPVDDRRGVDAGMVDLLRQSVHGPRDAASNWERDWQEHLKWWDASWDSARRICFVTEWAPSFRNDTWR